ALLGFSGGNYQALYGESREEPQKTPESGVPDAELNERLMCVGGTARLNVLGIKKDRFSYILERPGSWLYSVGFSAGFRIATYLKRHQTKESDALRWE
ncbi:hypothetical protein COY95_01050, partial [Candidatus Woesearchaeota archaeon CG_4_10_14_0_8_um_filter_47_5]